MPRTYTVVFWPGTPVTNLRTGAVVNVRNDVYLTCAVRVADGGFVYSLTGSSDLWHVAGDALSAAGEPVRANPNR